MSGNKVIWGVILITVGFIILLVNLDILDLDFSDFFVFLWPALLIGFGLYLIARRKKKSDNVIEGFGDINANIESDRRKYSNVAGDQNYGVKGIEIDGLKFSTVFGDLSVNLSEGKLKPGDNLISLSAVFGDVTVVVPQSMEVYAKASDTFGDLHVLGHSAEGISNNIERKTDGYDTATSRVKIKAETTLGDVKIFRA